jgi:hypothetical protein
VIKPTFVVYLALFLFVGGSLRSRIGLMVAGGALVAAYFAYFYAFDAVNFANWRQTMHFYGLVVERGHGFLGLPLVKSLTGVPEIAAAYAVFVGLVLGSGWILSEQCLTEAKDKFALGVSVCLMLYPRLMAYDEYTLPFGLAVAVSCFGHVGRFKALHLMRIIQPVCLLFAVIGGQAGGRLLFGLYCVLLIGLAGAALAMRLQERRVVRTRRFECRMYGGVGEPVV